MSDLKILLLGPLRVAVDGRPVTSFEADTARALLAYLAVYPDGAFQRETLAGLLWPERPEALALQNLRQALSRLRRAIGDAEADPSYLLVSRESIQLNPEARWQVDVVAFDAVLASTRTHAHRRLGTCPLCVECLRQAVELYRGEFMAGFSLASAPYEEWMVTQRENLHIQALDALHTLAACHEERGELEQVLCYARRQLQLEPWREEAHRQCMRALALSGQRDAALAQYEACRAVLGGELGVEPKLETTVLYERIQRGTDVDELSRVPPHNLPAQPTPLLGREYELAQIADRLQDPACRLLTLTGPGGSGKTRLALAAAAAQIHSFRDGVFWVPLSALGAPESIVPAVAQAVGLSFLGPEDPRQQLLRQLRRREALLLLDNFEHLLDGAGLVADIMAAAPNIQLLVTSRERLGLQGEQLYLVSGIDYPDQAPHSPQDAAPYSAVQLFLQAVRRVRPGYQPASSDLAHVAELCRLVEGMPLAILLAASWADALPPAEITRQVAEDLSFLEAELRDLPARQRSMRAVFDASWRLLAEREETAFAALSVFRGGFTVEAAQHVAGAGLRILRSLVRQSFLQMEPDGRYTVHELLRQYAEDKLRERTEDWSCVRDRHCSYFAEYLGQREESFRKLGIGQSRHEIDNIRAAWRWMIDRGRVAQCRRAIGGTFWFDEGWAWCNERHSLMEGAVALLRRAEPSRENRVALGMALCYAACPIVSPDRERFHTLAREGHQILIELDARRELAQAKILACLVGVAENDASADQLLHESLSLARETDAPIEEGWALHLLGGRYAVRAIADGAPRGEAWQRAKEALYRSLETFRRIGHRRGEVFLLMAQAQCAHLEGQYTRARSLYDESLALFRALGVRTWILYCLGHLGSLALTMGDHQAAEAYFQRDLDKARAWGNPVEARSALCGLGETAVLTGELCRAADLLRRTLQGTMEDGGLDAARIVLSMARWSAQRGDRARAVELLAFAYHCAGPSEAALRVIGHDLVRELQSALPSEVYAAAQERGRARDVDQTLRELLTELGG